MTEERMKYYFLDSKGQAWEELYSDIRSLLYKQFIKSNIYLNREFFEKRGLNIYWIFCFCNLLQEPEVLLLEKQIR